jgi:NAD(P)-dependent dehydrogenase (short-subunit alcohol dehydrogenase family)
MTSSQQSLRGQTALVTGATSGIGRATAIALAREGAEVIVRDRDPGRGDQVVAEITGALGKARFVAADLSDPTEIRHLADEAGDVDVLVNNAGFSWFGPPRSPPARSTPPPTRPASRRCRRESEGPC